MNSRKNYRYFLLYQIHYELTRKGILGCIPKKIKSRYSLDSITSDLFGRSRPAIINEDKIVEYIRVFLFNVHEDVKKMKCKNISKRDRMTT